MKHSKVGCNKTRYACVRILCDPALTLLALHLRAVSIHVHQKTHVRT